MKLHFATMAPNPDRVRFFLQEKGVWDQVEKAEISIMKGEHKQPGYRAISPMAQVPTLELDDGTGLTESRAICLYFEALYPEPNLMGREPLERATVEMWDRRVELSYFMQIAGWFRNSHPAMAELEKPQIPGMGGGVRDARAQGCGVLRQASWRVGVCRGRPLHDRGYHAPCDAGIRTAGEVQAVGRAREPERVARADDGAARVEVGGAGASGFHEPARHGEAGRTCKRGDKRHRVNVCDFKQIQRVEAGAE